METTLARPTTWGDPDADLVRRLAAGEEAALADLYARYGRRLYVYAYRLTGGEARAEEVLQDSLLAAWQAAPRFRGEAKVATWLLGIVHHQALNATRRKRLPVTELDEAAAAVDEAAWPDRRVEAVDRQRVLRAALDALSPEHRQVLDLVFYQGLPLAEVARVRGCPVGTVKSRLSYAKVRLRAALERAGLRAEDLL